MERPEPEFFAESNIGNVNVLIGILSMEYSQSLATIEAYNKIHNPETQKALLDEVKDSDAFKQLTGMLGSSMVEGAVSSVTVTPMDDETEPITEEQYVEASLKHDERQGDIVDVVGFLQEHAHAKIVEFGLGFDEEEALEQSWRTTWMRVINNVKPLGGVILADVADLFDGLVQLKYQSTYDPVHIYRGEESKNDVSARMFYEVFAPHLTRAITRSGEDNWTGH